MPISSRETVEVPPVSIPTWLFGSPERPWSKDPIILDPEDPETRHLSLHSYRYWSQRLAAGLQDVGLEPGQRVLLLSENSTAGPIVVMGILMAGGVFSGQSPKAPIEKLFHQASLVQPSIIIVSEQGREAALQVASHISLSDDRIYLFDDRFLFDTGDPSEIRSAKGERHWAELLKETSLPFDWTPYANASQLAAINFTSGSTGNPKGVLVTHYNLIANSVQYMKQQSLDPHGPEQGTRLTWIKWTPIYHVIGLTQYCMTAPKRGIINYIMSRFDLETMLRYAARYQANALFLLPAVAIAMLSHPTVSQIDLSAVNTINIGGAPLRESTLERLRDLFPRRESIRIMEGWGMTEVTALAICRSPLTPNHIKSHGELLPNCMGKVMTPDGSTELGPNQAGEVYVKCPNVAQGYIGLPEITKRTFLPDGWLRTGDLGLYDSEGNWNVKDRMQDIIYHESGSYALPTDLESALIDMHGVKDAGIALVEQKSEAKKRVARAFVVLDHTKQHDVSGVNADFNRTAKVHEQLRGGIFETEAIPRLPSGKVDRVQLRNRQVND